jgi:adenylate kinase family enzyme
MDGNYRGTMDVRIESADTIIYLDYPTLKCFWRAVKRIVKYHGKVRPDMPQGRKERFDFEFLHYVATFNFKNRKGILKKLNLIKNKKKACVFKTDKQANKFLAQISEFK